MIKIITILLLVIYNLTLLVGTAFLVQVYDWSPWWFLFTVLILGNYKKDESCAFCAAKR